MQTPTDTLNYHFGLDEVAPNNLPVAKLTPSPPSTEAPATDAPTRLKLQTFEPQKPLFFSEQDVLSKKATIKIPEPFVPQRKKVELSLEERTAKAFSKRSLNGMTVALGEKAPKPVPGVSNQPHYPQSLPLRSPVNDQNHAPRPEDFHFKHMVKTFKIAASVLILTLLTACACQAWTIARKDTPIYMKQAGDLAVSCGASSIALQIFNENLRKPENVNILVEWGGKFRAQQNYRQATEFYNRAINLNPDYPLAYLNRGATYLDMGQPQKALADANKAISLKPDYAMAYNNRGCTYVAIGKLPLAAADYSKAISLEPHTVRYWVNRGNCYLQMKQYKLAVQSYDYAIAHGSEPAIELREQAQKSMTPVHTAHSKKHHAHKTTTAN